nr:hypothetical protein CPGR_01779 [Mycolicibacterium komanii]
MLTAVMDAHDVRMPQRRCQVGFPKESLSEVRVSRDVTGQQLDGVMSRQSRMSCEVNLAHPAGAQSPDYRISGELLPLPQ